MAVPLTYWNPFDFALPIALLLEAVPVFWVPGVLVAAENKLTFLNASTSPLTNPTSGDPYTFVTFTKLPTSNLVLNAFCVSKLLALFTSKNFVPIVSIS